MTKRNNKYKMTEDGLLELRKELEMRINNKRAELKDMIEKMREKGDLSENDGYTLALEDYESNERRLAQLTDLIENAEIIETKKGTKNKAVIGCEVKVEINGKEITYTLVGPSEANPLQNKLSAETPIGKAIIGRSAGEEFEIELPMSKQKVKIVSII